ncbi:MAG TPA: hypothetical protein H9889_05525 [Candidatus Ignatzschineria merdigallinarum]|uniref:Pentapeptide repeat-containing protein n=1 Tax=Candidatus Ignatzschineria merdigallinarum TaxID=2838621 RepID=A0A9D1TU13_9GAMM|nr:hypothetical protein [Candidatus Ignatzschineria merdigallinarum]
MIRGNKSIVFGEGRGLEKICNIQGCKRNTFEDSNECILHCNKINYNFVFESEEVQRNFYDELINYLIEIVKEEKLRNPKKDIDDLVSYLKENSSKETFLEHNKDKYFKLNYIFFPELGISKFNYLNILKNFDSLHFNKCKFVVNKLDLGKARVFYDGCVFCSQWNIISTNLLEEKNNVIYQNCTFRDQVQVFKLDNEDGVIDYSLFHDCSFDVALNLHGMTFKSELFNNSSKKEQSLPLLSIDNCTFEQNFILNKLIADCLVIKDAYFLSKVEIKNSEIHIFNLENTNFHGLFDAYGSKFGEFKAFKSIFRDFVGFELCKFSVLQEDFISKVAVFQYVTFLSFTNFRNTIFYGGLNLEDANLKEPPNFLNIELKSNNTNRETLRIIKDSFDRVGNHIEANKFFVLEMEEYKRELHTKSKEGERSFQERFIYWFNENTSCFGQSYVLPIYWIFILTSMYSITVHMHKEKQWNLGIWGLDYIAQYLTPFKDALVPGMEAVSVIFYIILSTLIWQTIVAVKRYTKR